jgi:hypothetical protein
MTALRSYPAIDFFRRQARAIEHPASHTRRLRRTSASQTRGNQRANRAGLHRFDAGKAQLGREAARRRRSRRAQRSSCHASLANDAGLVVELQRCESLMAGIDVASGRARAACRPIVRSFHSVRFESRGFAADLAQGAGPDRHGGTRDRACLAAWPTCGRSWHKTSAQVQAFAEGSSQDGRNPRPTTLQPNDGEIDHEELRSGNERRPPGNLNRIEQHR